MYDSAVELPALLGRYFWDYAPGRLAWPEHSYTIILRLLEKGGWDAVRWLRSNVSDADLREFITERRGRGLDPKRLRYWELILGLPGDQVDVWVQSARQSPWYNR
jgi:hypothetical protein